MRQLILGTSTMLVMAFVITPASEFIRNEVQAQDQPADTKIAFVSDRDGNREIYVMNPDGSNPIRLTNNPLLDTSISWSPDGGRIAFERYNLRDGTSEIYLMNSDGSNPVRIRADGGGPSWSPDGRKIAFYQFDVDEINFEMDFEIYVMNSDGSNPVNLTKNPADDTFPSWSPDGGKVAFVSYRDGNSEIYVMNPDGSNPIRLTKNPSSDYSPSWSPDGTKIAFHSERDGNREVYVMDSDGSNPVNLTKNPANDCAPSWSPDGRRIAFQSTRDTIRDGNILFFGNPEIYAMNSDGSDPVRLTKNAASDSSPSWSPQPLAVFPRGSLPTLWSRVKRTQR